MLDRLPLPEDGFLDGIAAFALRRAEAVFVEMPAWFVTGSHRFYWLYFVSFIVLGALARRLYYRDAESERGERTSLFRFLFPREQYLHPSARLDYKILLANRLFTPSTLLARVLLGPLTVTWMATVTHGALTTLAGDSVPAAWTTASLAGFVVCAALVDDFATYVVHALHHRSPLLWEFHKVHHTAEVLTPFTLYRKHPIYSLLSRVTNIAIIGPFEGLIAFLFAGPADAITFFGANVVFSTFHLLGSNLRHSHVWLSFGPKLSHVLMSPAQHQIHHSRAPRHWNKNYGEVFAIWDWIFGTLHVPGREREVLEFGVAGPEGQEHGTLWQAYWVPFRNCGRLLRERAARLLPVPAARS